MIGAIISSFCLGGFLGACVMALANVSSKGSRCEECIVLHEAQKPAKATQTDKRHSIKPPKGGSGASVFYPAEATYTLLEDLPQHTPIRKKDRRPYFKKHNK